MKHYEFGRVVRCRYMGGDWMVIAHLGDSLRLTPLSFPDHVNEVFMSKASDVLAYWVGDAWAAVPR